MSKAMTPDPSPYAHLCGWVPPEFRNTRQKEADSLARAEFMPRLPRQLFEGELPQKRLITDLWKHERTKQKLGREFGGIWQKRGSCVGAGGGTMLMSLILAEIIIDGDREEIEYPFWLIPYAVSRQLAGIRGRGDGSLGTTFAQACKQGFVQAGLEGLPALRPDGDNFMTFGAQAEYDWSDASRIDKAWLEKAKANVVGETVVIKKAADAKAVLASWHPMTIAYDYYCSPDNARVQGSGENTILVGKFDSYGGHQTSIQGYTEHPELGLMFYNCNQWGPVYEVDPVTGLKKGCWITAKELEKAASENELIAFSGLKGFIARSASHDY